MNNLTNISIEFGKAQDLIRAASCKLGRIGGVRCCRKYSTIMTQAYLNIIHELDVGYFVLLSHEDNVPLLASLIPVEMFKCI